MSTLVSHKERAVWFNACLLCEELWCKVLSMCGSSNYRLLVLLPFCTWTRSSTGTWSLAMCSSSLSVCSARWVLYVYRYIGMAIPIAAWPQFHSTTYMHHYAHVYRSMLSSQTMALHAMQQSLGWLSPWAPPAARLPSSSLQTRPTCLTMTKLVCRQISRTGMQISCDL